METAAPSSIATTQHSSWQGLKAALPIMAGFVPFALVLGAQATQKGMSGIEATLLGALNFTAGASFAVVELWTSPPHILLLVAISLLINSRHLIMGAILSQHMSHIPTRKALVSLFFMCDESWAVGLNEAQRRAALGIKDSFDLPYYLGAALGLYVTWVTFTALGAYLGPLLNNVENYGFHMAFPAIFLVLMRGMWKGVICALPWLVSLIVAAATYLNFDGPWYVVTGTVAGLALAFWQARDAK